MKPVLPEEQRVWVDEVTKACEIQTMFIVLSMIYSTGCSIEPTEMPTETLVAQNESYEIPAGYQLIYDSPGLPKPDANQQRVRVLLWLKRMNFNSSQLEQLENLRQRIVERHQQLILREEAQAKKVIESETPIYNQIWDALRQGKTLESSELEPILIELNTARENNSRATLLDARMEAIKAIIEEQGSFLRSLSPEQEATTVDALFFLRHLLDPIGNPRDFSLLVGNTYEPGQYAILMKGTSQLARQSGNIGGLWSDEPELTGRVLHEAQREVIIYLALLEPALEEAIRAAKEGTSL
jgi:hypothetical protein